MSSYQFGRSHILAAIMILMAAPVLAQPQPDQRGFLMGLGGAAMTEVTSGTFAGAAGVNLGRNVQLTGEVGRMQDLFASFSKEDLRIFEQDMTATEGLATTVKVKMPAVYAIGGIRLLVPTRAQVAPYVTATAGVAHLTPEPTFLVEGLDLTSTFMQEQTLKTALRDENRPIAGVGAGVAVTVARHLTFDLGYKYSRIFIKKDYLQAPAGVSPHQHNGLNVHRVQVGVGYAF